MSQVGDTSNQTPDIATPRSTSRSGAPSGHSVVGDCAKTLTFNEHGLPIGDNSKKSSSRLGHLARTHIPICYTTWPRVPKRHKDQLWKAYKDEFLDIKESQRDIFMKKACESWKKFKSKLRVHLVGDDVSKWKEKVPLNIRSEDWEEYCDNEATENQKELRKRNKAIKDNCERKTTHNTGRNGYARAAEKWKHEHKRVPTRAELWLATHKRKDGSYAPYDKTFADKVEMLLKLFKERGEEETLDGGPLYETFGKEMRGRVRCIGSTISRKAMLSSAFARDMLKEVNTEREEWMDQVVKLREDMDGVKSTLAEFINDIKSGKFASVPSKSTTITPTTNSTSTPTSATHARSTSQFLSLNDLTPCKILSHAGGIVGYGRKTQIGAVASVHGRTLSSREVRIVLDNIKVPDYVVWGGNRGSSTTLADVGKGGFMYWHNDFLPPIDDANQEH